VRAQDLKTAKEVDSPGGGANLIFIDPDGDRFHIVNVQAGGDDRILAALDEALAKYKDKDIKWFDGLPYLASDDIKDKLVVYAFVDDKDASNKTVKALSHPWIAKDHERMVFVKVLGRDNDIAKKLGVATIPSLVYVAPSLKESERLVERKGGESTLRAIRSAQKKAFEKMKKAAEAVTK
jgi:hypothetical protein